MSQDSVNFNACRGYISLSGFSVYDGSVSSTKSQEQNMVVYFSICTIHFELSASRRLRRFAVSRIILFASILPFQTMLMYLNQYFGNQNKTIRGRVSEFCLYEMKISYFISDVCHNAF
jgi:hypothetical protein